MELQLILVSLIILFNYSSLEEQNNKINATLPCLMNGEILLSPRTVTDGRAMIGLPRPSRPSAAPRMKST